MTPTEVETKIAALEDEIKKLTESLEAVETTAEDLRAELEECRPYQDRLTRAIELLNEAGIIFAPLPHTRAMYVNGERELP